MTHYIPSNDALLTPVARPKAKHQPEPAERYSKIRHREEFCGSCGSYKRVSEFITGTRANPRRSERCRACREGASA